MAVVHILILVVLHLEEMLSPEVLVEDQATLRQELLVTEIELLELLHLSHLKVILEEQAHQEQVEVVQQQQEQVV